MFPFLGHRNCRKKRTTDVVKEAHETHKQMCDEAMSGNDVNKQSAEKIR